MSSSSNTWYKHYRSLPSNGDYDRAINTLAVKTEGDLSLESTIQSYRKNKDYIVAIRNPLIDNIECIHRLSKIGGTRIHPKWYFVALSGFGSSATPLIVDTRSLCDNGKDDDCPSAASLRILTTTASLDTYHNNETAINQKNGIIIPPFLWENWSQQTDFSPLNLCAETVNTFNSYDAANAADHSIPSAWDTCVHIVQWLLLQHQITDCSTSCTLTSPPSSVLGLTWAKQENALHIIPLSIPKAAVPLDMTMALIGGSVSNLTTLLAPQY